MQQLLLAITHHHRLEAEERCCRVLILFISQQVVSETGQKWISERRKVSVTNGEMFASQPFFGVIERSSPGVHVVFWFRVSLLLPGKNSVSLRLFRGYKREEEEKTKDCLVPAL